MGQEWVVAADLRGGVENERVFLCGACRGGRGFPPFGGKGRGGMVAQAEGRSVVGSRRGVRPRTTEIRH